MYKGLGFEPVADRDGRVTKMLIRASGLASLSIWYALTPFALGAQSGDIHCVEFGDNQSAYENAHNLWRFASS